MCVSNEPGFYKDGEYGIRIENVIMVNNHPKFSDRLYFENLTFCPYSRELINTNLLSPVDKAYLNEFNKKVILMLLIKTNHYSVLSFLNHFSKEMIWHCNIFTDNVSHYELGKKNSC
jgi:Xaa-Pro aminopeptidase